MPPLAELVAVTASGAIKLGNSVACDGFSKHSSVRVQTHAHDDHLKGFNSSQMSQDIVLTPQTRGLLSLRKEYFGLKLPRSTVHEVEPGESLEFQGCEIELYHSNHILGGVQVCVQLPDGRRVGYSSDFDWPLDATIQVDALVVDSTAGHPNKILTYTQGDAEAALLTLSEAAIKEGPVDICGSQRGIVQRAMNVLSPMFPDTTFLCSGVLEKENRVYRDFGYSLKATTDVSSSEGRRILNDGGRFIRFRGRSDKQAIGGTRKTKITLSPFPCPNENPVNVWSSQWPEKNYTVGLYDHADFEGTIAYIRKTGARYVLTDSRGQYAYQLANEIRQRLNIESRHSAQNDSLEWGG